MGQHRQRLPRRRHADGRHERNDQLIAELSQQSVEFARSGKAMTSPATARAISALTTRRWVRSTEFTSLPWRPSRSFLLVFNPATTESQRKIHGLLQGRDPRRRRAEGKIQHQRIALQRVDPQPAIEPASSTLSAGRA